MKLRTKKEILTDMPLIVLYLLIIILSSWGFYKGLASDRFRKAVEEYSLYVTAESNYMNRVTTNNIEKTYPLFIELHHKCDSLEKVCNKLKPTGFFELNP